jgi:putative ABC transport system permease protein
MRVVRAAGRLVPDGRRGEWIREWEAELWQRSVWLDRSHALDAREATALLVRTLGAFPHALSVLHEELNLDAMLQDLRFALRGLLKRPAFNALVVLTLALGLGANSAMFSIVNSVLIKPLPYAAPDELVYLFGAFKSSDQAMISPPDFLDYRERATSFASFGARTIFGLATLSGAGAGGGVVEPERVTSSIATANFFSTLGVTPLRGRAFLPEEEVGDHHVVILAYGLWQRRYGGDPNVVGRTITIDGGAHTVVGVMPPVLDRTIDVQIWRPIPFQTPGTSVRRFHYLRGVARLRPGTSIASAQAELDGIARQIGATYPEVEGWRLRIVPYQEVVVGDAKPALLILLGAVGLVLLVTCGNVAGLLLARATARSGEVAIRSALGARRGRLVRQLLTESLLLGALAGAVGLGLSWLMLAGVRSVGEGMLPRLGEIALDGTAIAFTVVLSLVMSLAFGLAPALHTVRVDLASMMKSLGKSSSGRSGARARATLVIAQVALSFVLLAGAGLLIRSLRELQSVQPGFDADGVFTAQVELPGSRVETRRDVERFWDGFLERVRAIPGVRSAAATSLVPMRGGGDTYFWVEDRPPASDAEKMNVTVSTVTDGYFDAMRIPLETGRAFTPSDGGDSAGVVIINRRLADRLFPGESPLGRRLVVDFGKPYVASIVGVAADVRVYGQVNDPPDIGYFSIHQARAGWGPNVPMALVARVGSGDPASIAPQVRAALHAMEPDLPLARPETMESILRDSVSGVRFRTTVLGAFAGAALLLAVMGLYGVLAFSVARRTQEMGIRIALGARAPAVFSRVVREGMVLVLTGLTLGVVAEIGATRWLSSQLFGVRPTDPAVFVAVATALLLAGLVACVIPARRATNVDPIRALRAE